MNNKNNDVCMQGVITTDDVFEIKGDKILFKNSQWGLEMHGSANYDMNTVAAIKNCLERTYKQGFSDGAQTGLKLHTERLT